MLENMHEKNEIKLELRRELRELHVKVNVQRKNGQIDNHWSSHGGEFRVCDTDIQGVLLLVLGSMDEASSELGTESWDRLSASRLGAVLIALKASKNLDLTESLSASSYRLSWQNDTGESVQNHGNYRDS